MSINITQNQRPVNHQVDSTTGKFDWQNAYHSDLIRDYFDKFLTECYPNDDRFLEVMDLIGNTTTTKDWKEEYFELGVVRKQVQISTTTAYSVLTPTTGVITLEGTQQYLIPKDEIQLPSKVNVRVTAISTLPVNTITIESVTGATISAADVPLGEYIYHVGNFLEPCYELPTGRHYFPDKKIALCTTVGRNYDYCEQEVSQPTWFNVGGSNYWVLKDQQINRKEHWRDVVGRIFFGQATTAPLSDGATSSSGIIENIMTGGLVGNYVGTLTEDDFIDFATELKINNQLTNEYLVVCGSKFFAMVTKSLKDYRVQAGCCSGVFEKTMKFNLPNFQVNGISFMFMESAILNEPEPSANPAFVDWRQTALFINVGSSGKAKGIELKYKESYTGGVDKMYTTDRLGHYAKNQSGSHTRSLDKNCFGEAITTTYMLKMLCIQNHAILTNV